MHYSSTCECHVVTKFTTYPDVRWSFTFRIASGNRGASAVSVSLDRITASAVDCFCVFIV